MQLVMQIIASFINCEFLYLTDRGKKKFSARFPENYWHWKMCQEHAIKPWNNVESPVQPTFTLEDSKYALQIYPMTWS